MLASNETVILEVLRQALNVEKLTTACFKNPTPPSKPVVKKRVEKELLELLKAGETLLHVRRSTDLGFELDQEYIPLNFLQATSRSDPSSTSASGLLCRATTWYVDVTFKPCRIPFTQLLFINAFVKRSELAKQVYFLFIFMIGEKYRNLRTSSSSFSTLFFTTGLEGGVRFLKQAVVSFLAFNA
ncbi:hypothetical protein pdam_00025556 [Pocillopora damicornis]|uniref:Uncharacterized protein n=1 Tax=Pocillopora damicornis TaxID=46731 RepID=A0A3M6TDM1_POCDA|nr:hypothetical protein pdam_00025556 [Pocillopora damicornis]